MLEWQRPMKSIALTTSSPAVACAAIVAAASMMAIVLWLRIAPAQGQGKTEAHALEVSAFGDETK